MDKRIFMKFLQLCHGIEQLDGCRQWYIQMIIFRYKFDLPCIFESKHILVDKYATPKIIGYIVDKKVVSVKSV